MEDYELDQLENREQATDCLAEYLRNGTLALVLGAGTSEPLGLPNWKRLLKLSFESVSLTWTEDSARDLELAATLLATHCTKKGVDLRNVLTEALYPKAGLEAKSLMTSSRLGALGALLMGSSRGSVTTVLTFNFDSVLEEYLQLHGYTAISISSLPALEGNEDVDIFHVNGYLPSKTGPGVASAKDDIVLTKESINRRLGNPHEKWGFLIRSVVRSKVLLILGLGPSSTIGGQFGPIVQFEADFLRSTRPAAFWFVKGLDDGQRAVLRSQLVVPIEVSDFAEADDFILEVCQKAARKAGFA